MKDLIYIEVYKRSRKLRSWLGPILLFTMIMLAFPLSIDRLNFNFNDLYLSLIVVSLLMTIYLSIDDIFFEDYEDGSLEQNLIHHGSLFTTVLSKTIALIFMTILPLSLLAVIFASANGISNLIYIEIFFICFFCQIIFLNTFLFGSAIGVNKGGMLGIIVVMPIALPTIVLFGKSMNAIENNFLIEPLIAMSAGISILSTILISFISGIALKTHLE